MARKARKDRVFDNARGVDTGGVVPLDGLEIQSPRRARGSPYWAVDPDELVDSLDDLDLQWQDFVFVDLGSGKGRALLIAAERPFRRIIGVEFARELHEAAQRNIRAAKVPKSIELLCMDAVDFSIPVHPLVIFLFNPFDGDVMAKVAAGVARSFAKFPRPIVIVYENPIFGEAWVRLGFRETRSRKKRYSTYQLDPGAHLDTH